MAVYNIYRGNGSRAVRVDGHEKQTAPPGASANKQPARPPQMPVHGLPFLGNLPKKLGELETEDLLLILILYLMYRESGDRELLIIMGAMYLL